MNTPYVLASTAGARPINDDLTLSWIKGTLRTKNTSSQRAHPTHELGILIQGAKELE
jgi:hypothetical protein